MKSPRAPENTTLEFTDAHVPCLLRRHRRARRISLRLDAARGLLVVTLPQRASVDRALEFARSKETLICKWLRELPGQVRFEEGAVLPLRGESCTIRHRAGRGGVWLEGNIVHVTGAKEHLPRRVRDWIIQQARQDIMEVVESRKATLAKPVKRVSVRDMRSRWGSCGRDGRLSLSWRLIFAPAYVLEYVTCHEMAHLAHLNHSKKFWAEVEKLFPNWREAEAWLNRNGLQLYRYG